MDCQECSELTRLLSVAVSKHEEIRKRAVAAIKAFDGDALQSLGRELEFSAAEMEALKTKRFAHEAVHIQSKPLTGRATGH